MNIVSSYITYRLVRLLIRPFKDWEACRLGLIDKDGNILRKPLTQKEKNAFGSFERIILKIKKIIVKLTGPSKAAAILTTLLLVKEENEQVYEGLYSYISKEIIGNDLKEESMRGIKCQII